MREQRPSETSVLIRATRRNIPVDGILHLVATLDLNAQFLNRGIIFIKKCNCKGESGGEAFPLYVDKQKVEREKILRISGFMDFVYRLEF
jgi:hypothetical protein